MWTATVIAMHVAVTLTAFELLPETLSVFAFGNVAKADSNDAQPIADKQKEVVPSIALQTSANTSDPRRAKPASDAPKHNSRRPTDDADLKRWLQNMVWHHRFTTAEIVAATGLSDAAITAAVRRFDITPGNRPSRQQDAPLLVLPYPGGRHPRVGFLEGAIRPQRDTKVSVFTPWDPTAYIVLDVPEAVRGSIGGGEYDLLYLAHTHTETVWSRQGITLQQLEWQRDADGSLSMQRRLPNNVAFGTKIIPGEASVRMEAWLTNGSDQTLSRLLFKNCTMLKGAPEFAAQTDDNKVVSKPYVACRSDRANRWIITAWKPCQKARVKAVCPCMHSDATIPDCAPGETRRIQGWFSFYNGTDIEGELQRIEAAGWWKR
jgi:hypothetical protein